MKGQINLNQWFGLEIADSDRSGEHMGFDEEDSLELALTWSLEDVLMSKTMLYEEFSHFPKGFPRSNQLDSEW